MLFFDIDFYEKKRKIVCVYGKVCVIYLVNVNMYVKICY